MKNTNRMTYEELEALKPTPHNMVTLVCDDGYFKGTCKEIKVFAVFEDRFYSINGDGDTDWHSMNILKHYPSFKKPKTAYYFWRFWFKNGEIVDFDTAMSEDGFYADGNKSNVFHKAIKKGKISEAIFKVEGQE